MGSQKLGCRFCRFLETHRWLGYKKGRGVISPGPRLFFLPQYFQSVLRARSFLALLLFASQELVRDPAYRVRDSAYLIRDPAYRYRYRRGCFLCDDFPLQDLR